MSLAVLHTRGIEERTGRCGGGWSLILLLGIALTEVVRADVVPSALFSDHAVLQQGKSIPIWGTADPGESVRVTFGAQTHETTTDAEGRWLVRLLPLSTGEKGRLSIAGKNSITVDDVLVGEVWLCSGQSNMAKPLSIAINAQTEIAAAKFPEMRVFTVETTAASSPQSVCRGRWVVCTPEEARKFSATAYFFGRELSEALHRPVGLIVSAVGGTPIQNWMSLEALSSLPDYTDVIKNYSELEAAGARKLQKAKASEEAEAAERKVAKKLIPPASLYNGMISPLVPFAVKGVIWYQGEANARDFPDRYDRFLGALIHDWREKWNEELPFCWVQLPNYRELQTTPVAEGDTWPMIREGMAKMLQTPNTGMAVGLGLGEADNIHPRNKRGIGERLARWALGAVYAKEGVVFSGPIPTRHWSENGKFAIQFSHAHGGLKGGDDGVKGFAVCGANHKWVWADAAIKGDTVILSSPEVPDPVAARYAWADNPMFGLFNGAGLPASPFRTDDFPLNPVFKKGRQGDE